MSIIGRVQKGVVVFDQPLPLPEGTSVQIEPIAAGIRQDAPNWDAAMQAASELRNYDFDAWRTQREFDLQHATDHVP